MALTGLALTGWVLGIRSLVQVVPSMAPMQFNTAAGLFLVALSLLAARSRPLLSSVLGGLVTLLSAITLAQFVWAVDLGIDELIVKSWLKGDTQTPGRMGLLSASCLLTVGILQAISRHVPKYRTALHMITGLCLMGVSTLILMGHAVGIETHYYWGEMTRMSLQSAVAFLLLGSGLTAMVRPSLSATRFWRAAGVAAGSGLLAWVVWLGVQNSSAQALVERLETTARDASEPVLVNAGNLASALQRLSGRWSPNCAQDRPMCEIDVAASLRSYPAVRQLGWLEPGATAYYALETGEDSPEYGRLQRHVEPAYQESLLQHGLTPNPVQTSAAVLPPGTVADAAVEPGRVHLAVVFPRGAESSPLFVIVDPVRLVFPGGGNIRDAADGNAPVDIFMGGTVIAGGASGGDPDRPTAPDRASASHTVQVLGVPWIFRATAPFSEATISTLPDLVLIYGVLVSCLLGTTVYFLLAWRAHSRQITALNDQLEQRVTQRTAELKALNEHLAATIEEERKAAALVKDRDRQIREMADAMPLMVWSTSADGTLEYCNQHWENFTNLTREEILARGWEYLIHPQDLAEWESRWHHAISQGKPFELECRIRQRPQEIYLWHLTKTVAIRDQEGCVIRWYCTSIDIEEQKQTEGFLLSAQSNLEGMVRDRTAELRRSEEHFRSLVEGVKDHLIVMLDASGKVTSWNDSEMRIKRYSPEQMMGRDLASFYVEEDTAAGKPDEALHLAVQTGKCEEERWAVRGDGTRYWAEVLTTPLYSQDGELRGFSMVSRDITERKRAEEELMAQRRAAEKANLAKSEFLAVMSHEIRTPMNAILGMSDLLWETDLDPAQQEYVRIFRKAGADLLDLINDILDVTKIESGRISLEAVPFDLRRLVADVAELMVSKSSEKGLRVISQVDPNVATYRVGDAGRLRQILHNLMGNAVKFTDSGTVELAVSNGPSGEPGEVQFSVRDTGIGIPEEHREHIFEPFAQADSSITRRYGGTGLGLSICSQLIQMMGGGLTVTSRLGEGSTFAFNAWFEVCPEDKIPTGGTLEDLRGQRILIADGNATDRLILAETLRSWGLVTDAVGTETETIDELDRARHTAPYSLLILGDPVGETADRVAQRLKLRFSALQIVVLLAGDATCVVPTGPDGLAAAVATKPVRSAALIRILRSVLSTQADASQGLEEDQEERPLRILVAEDSEANQLLLQAYLESSPHAVEIAGNGREAVDAFAQKPFDLVVMDIRMPVMDGLSATRALRRLERIQGRTPVPILALTANARTEDVQASLQAGCSAHLTKPVSKAGLLKAIRLHTEGSKKSWTPVPEPAERTAPRQEPEAPDELKPIVYLYLTDQRDDLQKMRAALAEKNFEALSDLAHDLKGSGTAYGFPGLSQLGAAIETAASKQQIPELQTCLASLDQQLTEGEAKVHCWAPRV